MVIGRLGEERLACVPCYGWTPVSCWRARPERVGGAEEARTPDPLLAKEVLSQLSYGPSGLSQYGTALRPGQVPQRAGPKWLVGHSGLEPETSVLSGLRSNQLS